MTDTGMLPEIKPGLIERKELSLSFLTGRLGLSASRGFIYVTQLQDAAVSDLDFL